METAVSKDGTEIVYERTGTGPTVILVAGALTTRADQRPLAEALAEDMTVVSYDRRSRGDSTDTRSSFPETADHEIEDLQAVVTAIGESFSLYGHSSGAALALKAAARIRPDKLILHEAPFHPDSAPPDETIADYSRDLQDLFERGDDEGAVELFFGSFGMDEEQIAGMKSADEWSRWVASGRALAYDSAAMGDRAGGRIPAEVLPEIACPTLTLAGSETYDELIEVSRVLAEKMIDARFVLIGGANHESGPDLIAPPVRDFLVG